MNYILFDLELNSKAFKSKLPNEIIEIGAVKLNDALETVDSFQSFVKPKIHSKLFPLIKRKTAISQEDVNNAEGFKAVISRFREWIGEDYALCSWGHDDIHHMKSNCKLSRISIGWIKNIIDVQSHFSALYNSPAGQKYGLKNALLMLDIELKDRLHRAHIDAEYTAQVFIRIFSQLQLTL